jgi:hypothetical protein
LRPHARGAVARINPRATRAHRAAQIPFLREVAFAILSAQGLEHRAQAPLAGVERAHARGTKASKQRSIAPVGNAARWPRIDVAAATGQVGERPRGPQQRAAKGTKERTRSRGKRLCFRPAPQAPGTDREAPDVKAQNGLMARDPRVHAVIMPIGAGAGSGVKR